MNNYLLDSIVGVFLIIGFLALGWLALQLGEIPWITGADSYPLKAEFTNISGVKEGADVQVAGVKVGTVTDLQLDDQYYAVVIMQLDNSVEVPLDSIASIKSKGIIGDKFIQITPGGDSEVFKPDETIIDTESAVDLESLISKFAFGNVE